MSGAAPPTEDDGDPPQQQPPQPQPQPRPPPQPPTAAHAAAANGAAPGPARGRPRVVRGIAASPGVAVGTVYLLERGRVRAARLRIEANEVGAETARLATAISASATQMAAIRGRFVGGGLDHRAILEAHEMMLRDPSLFDEAAQLIAAEHINAEWALGRVIDRLRELFGQVSDAYLRERRDDVDFIGERILRNLVGQHVDAAAVGEMGAATVVLARELSPVDMALLIREEVAAFVTEVGGKISHTSIVARGLGLPAVVGARGALEGVVSGDAIIVDGTDGTVILRPSAAQRDRATRRRAHLARLDATLLDDRGLPARTLDGHEVALFGNIELPREVSTVVARGGAGIGLYRTEFMFLGRSTPPSEDDHYHSYRRIFDHAGEREVTVRTLDLGGDKLFGPGGGSRERNPALGLRGIRLCLARPEIFAAQIGGLLRAAVHGQLRIMLPLISGVDEIVAARAVIAAVADRLTRDGVPHRRDVPVGVMVETPGAVMVADALARHSDFFAVGTNDLLQYLLAFDRSNAHVAYLYAPQHPAVLRCLAGVVAAAAAAAIPVSVCGEMAGDAEMAPLLVGLGLRQLSMHAGAIPRVKQVVRAVRRADCEALVRASLACEGPTQVAECWQPVLAALAGSLGHAAPSP